MAKLNHVRTKLSGVYPLSEQFENDVNTVIDAANEAIDRINNISIDLTDSTYKVQEAINNVKQVTNKVISDTDKTIADAVKSTNEAIDKANELSGNQLKRTTTGDIISLNDVYSSKPLTLSVKGKTSKNLFPKLQTANTYKGITFTPSADGSVKVAGTSAGYTESTKPEISLKDGATYTLSIDGAPDGVEVTLRDENADGVQIYTANNKTPRTFVAKAAPIKRTVWIQIPRQDVTVYATVYPILVEGSKPQPWTPTGLTCIESATMNIGSEAQVNPVQLPIDLKANKLCSLPNSVHDELRVTREGNRGHVELLKRVAYVVGTKDSAWVDFHTQTSEGAWRYKFNSGVKVFLSGAPQLLYPITIGTSLANALPNTGYLHDNGDFWVFSNHDNLQDFLANIPASGFVAIAKMKEPQTIDLGYIDLPTLPAPNATVWTSSNMPAVTSRVEYVQDINIVLAQLMQQILSTPTN